MRVAGAGADGVVGRPLVEVLRRAGHTVVALTRANGVDLTRGRAVDGTLHGCDAVVDVTTTRARRARDAEQLFVTVTDALMDAGVSAGVRHHVMLSVVGLDGVEGPPVWAGKRAHEERVLHGPVPATVVRTTHLHDVAGDVMEQAREGEGEDQQVRVPPLLMQPVAVTDVALVLAELAAWRGVPFGPETAGEVLLRGRGARVGATTFDDWLFDEWMAASAHRIASRDPSSGESVPLQPVERGARSASCGVSCARSPRSTVATPDTCIPRHQATFDRARTTRPGDAPR